MIWIERIAMVTGITLWLMLMLALIFFEPVHDNRYDIINLLVS